MKILTILGTRPEIIRLSIIIEKLDSLCSHILVHTGQNFDPLLSDVFFAQLGVRKPDHFLNVRGETFGEQISQVIAAGEKVLRAEKPDRLLVLGDTNSGLATIVAKRMGIPVYHMEAGNRCYDDRVPEETNRKIIDHTSDVLMPYTERSRMNLLREGIAGERIYVTGNPILEVLDRHAARIESSTALDAIGVKPAGYFLVTMHRAENVDIEERLKNLTLALDRVQREFGKPVIVSTHPRTKAQIQKNRILLNNPEVRFLEPFGLFDFVALERNACCVLSDSGTVQEECCIFRVPNVTIRDVTERPETIECGSSILSGANPETIIQSVRTALSKPAHWDPPHEYLMKDVSSTVIRILTGYHWKQR